MVYAESPDWCPDAPFGVHDWELDEVHVSGRGADTSSVCGWCGAVRYEPGQAALRDRRPTLGGFDTT